MVSNAIVRYLAVVCLHARKDTSPVRIMYKGFTRSAQLKVSVCIDYDNLLQAQKNAGILDIVQRIFLKLPHVFKPGRASCEIRLYGGWYEKDVMTPLSQQVSATIQKEFPAVIRIPTIDGGVCSAVTSAELAVALLEEPAHHLFNTYRKKGRPNNIRVETPVNVGCVNPGCILPIAKKLLQTGGCSVSGCGPKNLPLVYRHEQKIVDTMLTCDLIYLAQQEFDILLIVSNDDDFLPPIRTLLLRGANVIRVHPEMSALQLPIHVGGSRLQEIGV